MTTFTRPGPAPTPTPSVLPWSYYQSHPYYASQHPYAAYEAHKLASGGTVAPYGMKPPAGPAPVAPAAPAPTMPWDTAYEQTTSAINRQRGDIESNYTTGNAQLGQTYGFSFDPVSQAVMADPSNPYSRAALLQRAYENNQRGTTNRMAAQGQLYAGSLQNAQNENVRSHDVGYDQLRRGFQQAALGLLQRKRQALSNLDIQQAGALGTRFDRAVAGGGTV